MSSIESRVWVAGAAYVSIVGTGPVELEAFPVRGGFRLSRGFGNGIMKRLAFTGWRRPELPILDVIRPSPHASIVAANLLAPLRKFDELFTARDFTLS